jgi:hypothetical protein
MTESVGCVLTRNLEGLKAGGGLRRQLAGHQATGVELVLTPDGLPQVLVQGTPLYFPSTPEARSAREAETFLENKTPDLIVFFGLGLGWHARRLRELTAVPIIVFEPGLDILAKVLPTVPLEVEGVQLITNTGHLIEEAGKHISPTRMNIAVGAIPSYRQLFAREFELFRASLTQVLRKVEIDQNTKSLFSQDWVTYPRDNLPTLVKSRPLRVLGEIFAGKTGILVGAGPSLDDNIEILKQAQGKALICAVHSAALPLARHGIRPDIVVILESHQLESFFEGIPDLDQIYLAPDAQTHPRHLQLGFRDLLTITTQGNPTADWFAQAYGINPLESGGSVACASFSLLHELGCDPIILVGMDAAFTKGRTHAEDAQAGCCRVALDSRTNKIAYSFLDGRQEDGYWNAQLVEAWGGRDNVLTRPVYSSFRHWFEAASQTWACDHTLINATEGGARFQGFQEMTLATALAEFARAEVPASRWIDAAVSSAQRLDPRPLGQAIRSELDCAQEAAQAARKADKLAVKALRLLRNRQLTSLNPVLDKLGREEKKLQGFTRQTRLLNSLIGFRAMALSRQPAGGQDQVSLTISSVEKSREISRMVMDGTRELEELYASLAQEFLAQDNPV